MLLDFSASLKSYQSERDELESEFVEEGLKNATESPETRALVSERCFTEAEKAESRWLEKISATKSRRKLPLLYKTAWKGFNKKAKMEKFT
jgi:hypothetical protein